jgi:UPF0148 protein
MPVRKEDEIMAEHLLKGGKMLEKSCKTCGCPLFEVKGKTLCVVCEERDSSLRQTNNTAAQEKDYGSQAGAEYSGMQGKLSQKNSVLADELAGTILALCRRIQSEKDPNHCLTLMNSVKTGTEALQILCQL